MSIARRAGCLLAVLTALVTAAPQAARAIEPPGDAVLLTAYELLQLYGGKTWKWGEGGAYFDLDGRRFRARTEDGGTFATGTWRITDTGKLCFTAVWGADPAPTQTCFEHMSSAGDIYQRRLPDGGWYLFKHARTEADDEYGKFVRQDLVGNAGTSN